MGDRSDQFPQIVGAGTGVPLPGEQDRRAVVRLEHAPEVGRERAVDPPTRIVRGTEPAREASIGAALGDEEAPPLCPGFTFELDAPALGRRPGRAVQRSHAHLDQRAARPYVKQSVFPGCFANGLPASEGRVLAATQRPLATSALADQSGVPAWETIPSWAVIGTDDHVIPEADQLSMAGSADAHITKVDAPHLSMISDPDVVARVIIRAARATS